MHQCLKCKKFYENEEVPIIQGCECGSRLFLFIKHEDDIKRAEKIKDELEQKIRQIDLERKEAKRTGVKAPRLRFGIETIRVMDMGIYEINLDALMKGSPIIVLSKGGSYIISLPSIFGVEEVEIPLK